MNCMYTADIDPIEHWYNARDFQGKTSTMIWFAPNQSQNRRGKNDMEVLKTHLQQLHAKL